MDFTQQVIDLAHRNVEAGGRPFATVIVRGDEIVAESPNLVAQTGDPTAHAEILAIRAACTRLGTEHLSGCTIYVLAHPCPMCLGSLYYCSPDEVVFLAHRKDYARYYTDNRKYFELENFYTEYGKDWAHRRLPMRHDARPDALTVFRRWQALNS